MAKKATTKKAKVEENVTYADMGREALEAELIKRGYDEADLIDLEVVELVAQLEQDDLAVGKTTVKEEPVVEEEITGDFIDIVKGPQYIRTYSKEANGSEYMEIAKIFCAKEVGREIVKPGKIKVFSVNYRMENMKTKAFMNMSKIFTKREDAIDFFSTLPGSVKKVIIWK